MQRCGFVVFKGFDRVSSVLVLVCDRLTNQNRSDVLSVIMMDSGIESYGMMFHYTSVLYLFKNKRIRFYSVIANT